ncbi:MAG TPA: ABC transporter ATP-binding protein [Candidatus Latescibacteria bacterium]|nr:ABC transporter ATP-binding protein [Candidatus Latescibacterota bacterium]
MALIIRELKKSLGGKPVLQGVDLEVRNGETLVILGQSGCGKTVLLKHIIGLMKPDEGEIWVDGKDITKLSFKELIKVRRQFGMVFQASALLDSMTVAENIGLSLRRRGRLSKEEIRRRVSEALEMVGLKGWENALPAELSGGMRKRVGLARAVVTRPRFLLYDEPTAGLDPVMARSIDRLIVHLKEHMSSTSIIVTHDIVSAFSVCDRIAFLHDGTIRFLGYPEEVRHSEDPVLREFFSGGLVLWGEDGALR